MTNQTLQANDSNPSAPSAARLLVAMEMSLKTWRLVMAPEGGTRRRVKAVEAGNFLELEEAVADARERFSLPTQTPLVFCYEAGRDGFYPYRRLAGAVHEVWVIDSASIEVSLPRRRQAKSDGIDGEKLAGLMQRRARGERKALRIVRVQPPEAEDERLLPREREGLLHDIGRLRNQAESILFTQGYCEVPKTASALKAWLVEWPGLAPRLRERLGRAVELAWLWLRHQPNSALTLWFKARFAGGGKRMRRIGIVALARRLAVALWRYADQAVVPAGAALKQAAKA